MFMEPNPTELSHIALVGTHLPYVCFGCFSVHQYVFRGKVQKTNNEKNIKH